MNVSMLILASLSQGDRDIAKSGIGLQILINFHQCQINPVFVATQETARSRVDEEQTIGCAAIFEDTFCY